MPHPLARLTRSAFAAVVAVAACTLGVRLFWLTGADALRSARASGPDAPADLLVVAAAGIGTALLVWLAVGVVLAALAALPGAVGRVADAAAARVAPTMVRRIAAALVGTAMATAATPAARADTTLPSPPLTTSTSRTVPAPAPDPAFAVTGRPPVADAPAPMPGPVVTAPDPAFGATPSSSSPPAPPALGPLGPAPHTPSSEQASRTVTVVRGDSLWSIAARHLGPHATAQQVAREWPRWYAANRRVIGSDPDLIRVGQVLTAPSTGAGS